MIASEKPQHGSKPPRPSRFPTYALLVLAAGAFLGGACNRELWSSREGRVAACAQGMLQSGDWLTPRMAEGNDPRLEKPPLAYWLAAVCGLLFWGGKVTELAAKMPSVLAAVGTVFLIFSLGCRALASRRAGFFAALALVSCALFWDESHVAAADMPMLFCMVLAIFGFWRVHFEEQRGQLDRALPWLALGLGFLAKGPVGPAVPLGVMLCLLLVLRRWRAAGEVLVMIASAGCVGAGAYLALSGRHAWIALPAMTLAGLIAVAYVLKWRSYSWLGLAACALVALPWYFAVAHRHPDALSTWLGESVGRVDAGRTSHVKPFYYYLAGPFWTVLLPWVALLPALGLAAMGSLRGERRAHLPGLALALVWTFGGLLFFSIFASKRQYYLLPLTPAFALGVGWLLDEFVEKRLPRAAEVLVRVPLGLFGALLALAPLAAALAPATVERFSPGGWPSGLVLSPVAMAGFAGAGGIIAAMSLAPAKRDWPLCESALVAAAGVLIWAGLAVLPSMNARKSPRALCREIRRIVPAGEKIVSVRVSRFPLMAYYLGWDRIWVCNKGKWVRRHMARTPTGFGVGERKDVLKWIKEGWLPARIRAESGGRRKTRAVLFEWNTRKKVKS
jgi:4-amino-4-deoxy-L-arabinose transferase-like glycosyltransferase